MAIYRFETQDGQVIRKIFPMGECPTEIKTQDGKIATRVYASNVSMFSAEGSSGSNASKLNKEMKARNEAAGKRMRERWKSCKSSD